MLNTEPNADLAQLFSTLKERALERTLTLNSELKYVDPLILIGATIALVVLMILLYQLYGFWIDYSRNLSKNIKQSLFRAVTCLPFVQWYIQKEEEKIVTTFNNRIKEQRKNMVYELP